MTGCWLQILLLTFINTISLEKLAGYSTPRLMSFIYCIAVLYYIFQLKFRPFQAQLRSQTSSILMFAQEGVHPAQHAPPMAACFINDSPILMINFQILSGRIMHASIITMVHECQPTTSGANEQATIARYSIDRANVVAFVSILSPLYFWHSSWLSLIK